MDKTELTETRETQLAAFVRHEPIPRREVMGKTTPRVAKAPQVR